MNFKKAILAGISFLVFSLTLSAQAGDTEKNLEFYKTLQNFSGSEYIAPSMPGDYVVYEDRFANNNLLLTIVHAGERRYILQTFNRTNYKVSRFLLMLEVNEGKISIEGISMIAGESDSTDVQLAQSDFLRMLNTRASIDVSGFPGDIKKTEMWKEIDSSFTSTFEFWIPVANLYTRMDRTDIGNYLRLVRFGHLDSTDKNGIFDFKGVNTSFDNSPSFSITAGSDIPVTIDGLTLKIDSNWSKVEDSKTLVLQKNGQRYASINIRTVKKEEIIDKGDLFFSWYLNNSGAYVLPESVEMTEVNGFPTLKLTVFNESTLEKSNLVLMFFQRGDYTSILTFSAFQHFYRENQSYFDKILY